MKITLPALATLLAIGLGSGQALAMGSDTTSNPTVKDAYEQAVDLIDDEEYAKAIPLLEKSIREKGEYADGLNQLGYANRKLGNWALSMEYYLKALKMEPDHLGANEYLGELYLDQKDLASAEGQLAKLKAACGDCDEYEELEESIADYKKENAIN